MNAANGTSSAMPATAASIGKDIRSDIESTLRARTAPEHTELRRLEEAAKSAGKRVWTMAKRHPYLGILTLAAGGVFMASTLGVGELAVGAVVAAAAFNVLKGGEDAKQACGEVVRNLERV